MYFAVGILVEDRVTNTRTARQGLAGLGANPKQAMVNPECQHPKPKKP